MEHLEAKKLEIEKKLELLHEKKNKIDMKLMDINGAIKDKASLHKELVSSVSHLRTEYKLKVEKFRLLKANVKEYKKKQAEVLEKEYQTQIKNIIKTINSLQFEFKLSIFKDFDELLAARATQFPILQQKITAFSNVHKLTLKSQILHEIKDAYTNPSKAGTLVFFLSFLIKYEVYFSESVFISFVNKMIKKEFEYHFFTDKDTNRLDKPEWFFEFLVKKYSDFDELFQVYSERRIHFGLEAQSITRVIENTQELVFRKLVELSKVESTQKRNLIIHFAHKFKDFTEKVKEVYDFNISNEQFRNLVTTIQTNHIQNSLSRIQELRYVLWFTEYRELCKDSIVYINNFRDIDTVFKVKDVIEQILRHLRVFLENLRFINREEVQVACFVFNELEDLKKFLETEESEFKGTSVRTLEDIASGVNKITKFNVDVFKLIKTLALNDVQNSIKKIAYFQYTSNEVKRTVIVEINKILEEYRTCLYFDVIEQIIQEKVDDFFVHEILLKIKMNSNEYLEFRSFYNAVKQMLKGYTWKGDEVCNAIDCVFDGRSNSTEIFQTVRILYDTK